MQPNPREILIYYNPESNLDKRAIAHASALSRHVRSFGVEQLPSTNTSWRMILNALGVHPKELLNKAHPLYKQLIRGRDFDDEGWLNVLRMNPFLLRAPIAMRGKRAILCVRPTDIYKLHAVTE